MKKLLLTACMALLVSGCSYTRFSHTQEEMLMPGIDIDQTIEVSQWAMSYRDKDSLPNPRILGFWAMRAQIITAPQAEKIATVYFQYIDSISKPFSIWHYTWAISDMYRLGDPEVQKALGKAHADAIERSRKIGKVKFTEGDTLLLGYFHGGGWSAAKKYLIVPGNKKFHHSAEEFFAEQKSKEKK